MPCLQSYGDTNGDDMNIHNEARGLTRYCLRVSKEQVAKCRTSALRLQASQHPLGMANKGRRWKACNGTLTTGGHVLAFKKKDIPFHRSFFIFLSAERVPYPLAQSGSS